MDVAPNSARMSGKATFTMNRSRLDMNTPTPTTMRTCHLRCMMQLTLDESVL